MKEIPQDVAEALKGAGLAAYFAGLRPAHQREYLSWITEAKRAETRQARIAKAMEMLSGKHKEARGPSKKKP